jgi:hypothetical protein
MIFRPPVRESRQEHSRPAKTITTEARAMTRALHTSVPIATTTSRRAPTVVKRVVARSLVQTVQRADADDWDNT